jgi:hypothetical protein
MLLKDDFQSLQSGSLQGSVQSYAIWRVGRCIECKRRPSDSLWRLAMVMSCFRRTLGSLGTTALMLLMYVFDSVAAFFMSS